MSENLSQKAYWYIHDKLTSGEFEPGFRLSNRSVAKEVGISFTPVREALYRLVSEGLLEYRQGLGVFVPKTTRREIEELYEVREMLECAVVVRSCGRLLDGILDSLRELQQQMRDVAGAVERDGHLAEYGERFWPLDDAFHSMLIRAMGNRQLLDTMADLRRRCVIKEGGASGMVGLVGHVFQTEPIEAIQRTCREHDHLLDLLQDSSKKEDARELMKNHIRAGRQLALAAFDRTYINSSQRASRRGLAAKKTFY